MTKGFNPQNHDFKDLPTSEDVHPTRTIHKGSHRVYTDALESKMNALVEIGEKNNWT